MPWLSVEEIHAAPEPRWPENKYGIQAPEGICGDYQCVCAKQAREVMTDAEYQLATGMPKEAGLPADDDRPGFTLRAY
jgi:hypothetical protein